eukprot:6024244-Amphidinium_carterae.1
MWHSARCDSNPCRACPSSACAVALLMCLQQTCVYLTATAGFLQAAVISNEKCLDAGMIAPSYANKPSFAQRFAAADANWRTTHAELEPNHAPPVRGVGESFRIGGINVNSLPRNMQLGSDGMDVLCVSEHSVACEDIKA